MAQEMKLIYLEWEDATSESSWHSEHEVEQFVDSSNLVKQVGWIYKENKEFLVLAGRMIDWSNNDPGYGQLQKIPKTWIRKRIVLNEHI